MDALSIERLGGAMRPAVYRSGGHGREPRMPADAAIPAGLSLRSRDGCYRAFQLSCAGTSCTREVAQMRRCAVLCTLSACLTWAITGCGEDKSAAAPQAQAPEVKVVAARSETVPVVREYVGSVEAYRSVQVRARVEGILERRHFTEGTDVKQGQLLYTIDPLTYEATLRDAEAELARAQADLANARTREARYAPLVKEDAISKQDYDDTVSQLKQAQAAVNAAVAKVDRAKLSLGYTRVHATEAGRIGESMVPEGALVGKGEPTLLATIDKLDPIHVSFTIPDRDALSLRKALQSGELEQSSGETARFLLPDGSEYDKGGRIDFADAKVNRETGTITLRAILSNTHKALLPGMFVRVQLTAGQRPNTVLIPQQAVIKVPTGHMAWAVTSDNKVERRDLVVGEWHKEDWIIEKGIAAGERVIVDGVQKVQPGITVRASLLEASAARQATPPAAAATEK
jgi:membrane fusion protein (multidrug efflux system)